jgi:mono/diheme cytochrome c family protein
MFAPAHAALPFLKGKATGQQVAQLSYNEHIQPILAENCFQCHGPDSASRKGKLRLDRFEFATAPRPDASPAIVPGKLAESALIDRITATDPDDRMPPADSHKQLKPEEIELLKRWVAEGAKYEKHWAFLPPTRPAVPKAGAAWARNPIDAFVAAKLEAVGLKPGHEEQSARLLRRVTLDLTGLPPTPAEIAAFAADRAPGAYERVVDRLLASDACAEQFARHWLDAVRYADTHGIHIDDFRWIWPYRDWVVNALRSNMPFDQFTIEQMAGDMLPNATLDQKVASGYNRCLATTNEGGAIAAEYEAIYAKDRVETMSTVWLGLTTGCATCHDHKFDPITQKEFYSLTAFFRNNTMPAMDGNYADTEPNLFVPAPSDRARWATLQAEVGKLKADRELRAKAVDPEFEGWLAANTPLVAPPVDHHVRWRLALDEASGAITPPTGSPLAAQRSAVSANVTDAKTVERVPGPFGPAPRINDLDLVLDQPVALTRDGQISFSLWVRVDGAPTGTLLSSLSADEPDRGWELALVNGRPGIFFSEEKDGLVSRQSSRQPLVPGRWHQLVVVCDGTAWRNRFFDLFVDGRTVASEGELRNFKHEVHPTAPLRLGARHSATGRPAASLTGGNVWVQDLRRYDHAFTVGEVAALALPVGVREALATREEEWTEAHEAAVRNYYLVTVDAPAREIDRQLDQLAVEEEAIRRRGGVTLVMEEIKGSQPSAHVLNRGEYSQPTEKVMATTPAVLPPMPADAPRNRLGLARWLVAPENPLTARVTMNRMWQYVFGTGLVESTGDFGNTGARPSHPLLLDWLAVEFRESGWDRRHMLRLMATSATYRQAAAVTPELLERDPMNRWLARGSRHRLDAEELRDQALAASGLLVARLGGEPARPYQPEGVWEEVAMKQSTTRYYHADDGENLYRRSLYTIWKRTAPPPAMDVLNAPSREVSCVRRDRTNTPLQALVTLNEPLFVEASRQLAARALDEAPLFDGRLDAISVRLLGRTFVPAERMIVRRTLDAAMATYRRDVGAAKALLGVGATPPPPGTFAPELAAWTVVASEVMNLDESLNN